MYCPASLSSKETADLVTFTEETLNGKLFFCIVYIAECLNVFSFYESIGSLKVNFGPLARE